MAGDSFAGSRLSPMTGTSSATAGAGIGLPAVLPRGSLAGPGLVVGPFTGAALPPLIARKTGAPCFATAALPANFADLLTFGISRPWRFTASGARIQCSVHRRYDATATFLSFGSDS